MVRFTRFFLFFLYTSLLYIGLVTIYYDIHCTSLFIYMMMYVFSSPISTCVVVVVVVVVVSLSLSLSFYTHVSLCMQSFSASHMMP